MNYIPAHSSLKNPKKDANRANYDILGTFLRFLSTHGLGIVETYRLHSSDVPLYDLLRYCRAAKTSMSQKTARDISIEARNDPKFALQ